MKHNHFLLTNGRIIDVETGQITDKTIEIQNGTIKHIYEEAEILPNDIKQVDADGKYIIPGLIDMHCHIQEKYAPHFVASGVTTIRNTAGDREMLKPLIDAPIDALTPTIYACDALIDGEPGLWGPTSPGNFVTNDPIDARKEVRRQAEIGATFIKVYCLIEQDVLIAIVDEASKYNLEVACDLIHSKEVDALLAAKIGVTWFEHASGFAQSIYPGWHLHADKNEWNHINWQEPDKERIEELCREMLKLNIKICPTMVVQDQAERLPDYWNPKNAISHSSSQYFKGHWDGMLEHSELVRGQAGLLNTFVKMVAKTYADLGGTVVAGSDTPAIPGIFPGMSLHRELELFVEAGFSPLAALQAATVKAAESIELHEIGLIKKDCLANLVLLDKNPLDDISNTQSIAYIVKGGKIYTQDEILGAIDN